MGSISLAVIGNAVRDGSWIIIITLFLIKMYATFTESQQASVPDMCTSFGYDDRNKNKTIHVLFSN